MNLPSSRTYGGWLALVRVLTGIVWLIHGVPKFLHSDRFMPPDGIFATYMQRGSPRGRALPRFSRERRPTQRGDLCRAGAPWRGLRRHLARSRPVHAARRSDRNRACPSITWPRAARSAVHRMGSIDGCLRAALGDQFRAADRAASRASTR